METTTEWLKRHLWTALVIALVLGGLMVAVARAQPTAAVDQEVESTTLAGDATPWVPRTSEPRPY